MFVYYERRHYQLGDQNSHNKSVFSLVWFTTYKYFTDYLMPNNLVLVNNRKGSHRFNFYKSQNSGYWFGLLENQNT